jgi:hypothetical protein
MSGMEPMLVGAMLGGGVSAARGGNPLKGALLGAVGGGLGGAALGAGNAAATAGMTGASAVPVGSTASAALPAAPGASGIFATATNPVFAATGGSTGLIPSITAPATLMDQVSAISKFTKENPFQMNMASNIMQEDAARDAQRMAEMRARSGLISGKQIQEMPQRSSFAVPQFSLI